MIEAKEIRWLIDNLPQTSEYREELLKYYAERVLEQLRITSTAENMPPSPATEEKVQETPDRFTVRDVMNFFGDTTRANPFSNWLGRRLSKNIQNSRVTADNKTYQYPQ